MNKEARQSVITNNFAKTDETIEYTTIILNV